MNKFEKMKALCAELKQLAMKYDITLITAVQHLRPSKTWFVPLNRDAPVFIDHVGMIK